jgi:hypothetical protein
MKRTLADVGAELLACDTKLQTEHTDDLFAQKNRLLEERTKLLLEELKPLRSAVTAMMGGQATMAATKKWTEDFKAFIPPSQMKVYEDALKLVRQLDELFHIETVEE